MTKYLTEGKFYMNPATGSVDSAEGWEADFSDFLDSNEAWELWGGDSLEEVKKDDLGNWVEVEE